MNGNSSKQVLLSVLGIAILVVAVVGVSFAFFSYTKAGTTNNSIATGEIFTYLTEGDQLALNNVFPSPGPGSNVSPTDIAGKVGHFQFSVVGKNESQSPINYKVYLQRGDQPTSLTGNAPRLRDDDVKIWMSDSNPSGNAGSLTNDVINSASSAAAKSMADATIGGWSALDSTAQGETEKGVVIATGQFPARTGDGTHTYHINMWIDDETVAISDTDKTVKNAAGHSIATRYCAKSRTNTPETNTQTGNGCELFMTSDGLKSASDTGVTLPAPTSIYDGNTEGSTGWLPAFSDAYYAVKIKVVANAINAS